MDSADELMDDGDNNNLINGRHLGAALPPLPAQSYYSEPMDQSTTIPSIHYDSSSSYYGDEFFDTSLYKMELTPSPKRTKKLPSPAASSVSHQTPSTPSLMTAAGAGLTTLFSSISHSLHSPATTTSAVNTATGVSTYMTSGMSTSSYGMDTTSYSGSGLLGSISYDYTTPYTSSVTDQLSESLSYGDSLKFTSTYGSERTPMSFTSTSGVLSNSYTFDTGVSKTFDSLTSERTPMTFGVTSSSILGQLSTTTSYTIPERTPMSYSGPTMTSYGVTSTSLSFSDSGKSSLGTGILDKMSNFLIGDLVTKPTVTETHVYSEPERTPMTFSSSGIGILDSLTTSLSTYDSTLKSNVTFTEAERTPMPTISYELPKVTDTGSLYTIPSLTSTYDTLGTSSLSYEPIKYGSYDTTTPTITLSTPIVTTSATSLYTSINSLYSPSSSSTSVPSTSTSNIYTMGTSLGLSLGHSPIPEEEDDGEMLQEDEEIAGIENMNEDDFTDPYTLSGDYIEPFVPATQSYTSDGFTSSSYTTTDTYTTTLQIPISAASMISSMRRISDPYAYLSETIDEEYHEDFEEGVQPVTVTESGDYDAYKSPLTYSSYPLTTKLSTIHETSSDVYLSPHDEHTYEDQITPTAYDYTENENEYLASGDLKNTNLMQNNNYAPYSTAPSTVAAAVSQQKQAPEQKKSLFGSLLSGGLDVIGSSVSAVKATATNLAATAVGAAGAAVNANSNVNTGNKVPTTTNTSSGYGQVTQNGPYSSQGE
jgi:hypothetical protein